MAPFVVVGTPCYGGLLTHGYTASLLNLFQYAQAKGIGLSVEFVAGDALITRARATIAAAFLDNPAATHLLFIDADITFKPEQLKRLLLSDRDMTAALYPLKSIDWQQLPERVNRGEPIRQAGLTYVVQGSAASDAVKDGFMPAEYAGTGFLLIRRKVFERMIAAYPETKFSGVHDLSKGAKTSDNLYALFDCMIDPATGVYLSEDYAFCRRWRQLGGEIWVDLRSELTHVGPYAFEGNMAVRYGR